VTIDIPEPRLVVPEQLSPEGLRGFDPAAEVVDLDGETMGTFWRVRAALPPGTDRRALSEAVQQRLDGLVAQMSHWDTGSLLMAFNQAPAGHWQALPQDFARVMACGVEIADRSGGAFDPALGRLTDLWGLGPNPAAAEPEPGALHEALGHSGWQRLAFDPAAGRLRQPGGLWLDLSGIAKGYAADAVADLLAARGVGHALAEVGGECVGRGLRPDGDPWWVEAEAPPGFAGPPLRIALYQLAVATSGDYLGGAHTLDPAYGRPAIHETTSVTVIAASCMEADAWASALLVLPFEAALALAFRERLCARWIARDGSERLSPALSALL
jgi:thiamine biosynthesis lipoprotein